MDFTGVIKVNRTIVHILNQEDKTHRLSDFEINVDERLSNLIIKHISDSLRHESRRYADFNSKEGIVCNSCIKILMDSNCFIEESKKISRQLFAAMKGTNASSANLLIVQYSHGQQSAIAILKLDFDDSFHTEEKEEEGKVKIEIKIDGAAFNKRQKLQKCAFIYDSILSEESSRILILDKQTTDDVSNYFGNVFLDCNLINDNKSNTKNMIKEFVEFINEKYIEDPKEQLNKTFDLTTVLENNTKFELETVLSRVFDEDEIKEAFKDRISNKEIDYEFTIDKPRVQKQLNNRTIVTENGISLRGKASLFNNSDIDITNEYEDGYVDIMIKRVKIKNNKL